MGKLRLACALLVSYVVLLVLSSTGIMISFLFLLPVLPKPPLSMIDMLDTTFSLDTKVIDTGTIVKTELDSKAAENRIYADASMDYADYTQDPRTYLVIPCGVNILMVISLPLGSLCSMKLFSTTAGLFSSVALWGLNVGEMVLFQKDYKQHSEGFSPFINITVLVIQIGMMVVLTLQVIMAAWELRKEKIAWPVIRFSQIISLNAVFLVSRIVCGWFLFSEWYGYFRLWRGLPDHSLDDLYSSDDYWDKPRIKGPAYLVFPISISILYGISAPFESLLSHLLGHKHTKLMSFTSVMSALLYGGVALFLSPGFMQAVFSTHVYPGTMNWAMVAMTLSLVHAIINVAGPSALNAPPLLAAIFSWQRPRFTDVAFRDTRSKLMDITFSDMRSKTVSFRSKLDGSDTLHFNAAILVLCQWALILEICFGVHWVGGIAMICGDAIILSRVVPAVALETLTRQEESVPILKMIMQVFIECIVLLTGCIGSFHRFYGAMAAAIVFNILVVMIQLYRLVTNPELRSTVVNLKGKTETGHPEEEEVKELVSSANPDETNTSSVQEKNEEDEASVGIL